MTPLLLNPTVAIAFYGSIIALVTGMCLLSGARALRLCATLLLADWIGYNLIFAWLHASHAPWLSPSLSALVCIGIAAVGIRERSNTAWWLVSLYVLELAVVVASFAVHQQGTIAYGTTLNLIFLGRMAVLGEAGFVELVDRLRRGSVRARFGLAGLARHHEG